MYLPAGNNNINWAYNSIALMQLTTTGRLEIKGDIKFGPTYNLFALGTSKNLRIIIGRVNSNGSKEYGEGFTSYRIDVGQYEVTFQDEYKFISNPIVLVTAGSGDSVTNTKNISKDKFDVWSYDVPQSGQSGEKENTPFDFIAIGER